MLALWGAQAQQALAALSRVPALASNAQLPSLAALRGLGAGTALQQQVGPPPAVLRKRCIDLTPCLMDWRLQLLLCHAEEGMYIQPPGSGIVVPCLQQPLCVKALWLPCHLGNSESCHEQHYQGAQINGRCGGLRQVLLSVLMASAGGGRATDATGERLRALLGTLAAAPAEDAPVLLAGLTGAQHAEREQAVIAAL